MDDVKGKVKDLMKKVNNPFSSSSSSSSSKFKGQGRVLGGGDGSSPSPSLTPSSHPLVNPKPKPKPKPTPQPPRQSPASLNGVPDRQLDGLATDVARVYLAGGPTDAAVEVVVKLLKNVVREPENAKYRRVRMGNTKIKEAVGDVEGGVGLLEFVGFRIAEEEDGESWATMAAPTEEQLRVMRDVAAVLERWKDGDKKVVEAAGNGTRVALAEQKKVDRQVRVFFLLPESVPEKIELPDSFYNLGPKELKREAELRKKKIAESQLLIPKSYKEKQMRAARKKYNAVLIRVQFPDGVVLQGVFRPWEPTTALYEFVSTSLKDPSLEFELLQPVPHKARAIPQFPRSGGKPPTLEEEDLAPSSLVKFKPIETDSTAFTGLSNQLLEMAEPLTNEANALALDNSLKLLEIS